MKQSYKTEHLPLNFLMLGITIALLGIAILISGDITGTIAILISVPFLFTHSGIIVDIENKRIKKFTGIFSLKLGTWVNISQTEKLLIGKVRQNQGMAVLSIARNDISTVHKLFAIIGGKRCEIVCGSNKMVTEIANQLAKCTNAEIVSAK